jgi:hypothetical protein
MAKISFNQNGPQQTTFTTKWNGLTGQNSRSFQGIFLTLRSISDVIYMEFRFNTN